MRNYRISCEDRSSPQATATIGTAQHAKAQTTRRPALAARTPVDLQRNPPQSLNLQLLPDRIQQNWRQNLYQCPDCETRYLAEQWSPDCARTCQRLGAGGTCTCCEEKITVEKLTQDTAGSQPLPAVSTPVHH